MKYKIRTHQKRILADTATPVSLYLKFRDLYPGSILLESSDYHGGQDNYSFICLRPVSGIQVEGGMVTITFPDQVLKQKHGEDIPGVLEDFFNSFTATEDAAPHLNGLFGYMSFDAAAYFEQVPQWNDQSDINHIPEIRYHVYQYIIAINHFKNSVELLENRFDDHSSTLDELEDLVRNKSYAEYPFHKEEDIDANMSDADYMKMVSKGKKHCQLGDVYQIVLSRRYAQSFSGDEFNVYRHLRSVNPSPYLFYFDYSNYKLFGSSPEAHLIIRNGEAQICPIAGTFPRTGDDQKDQQLAKELSNDPKENAEHVMLVDLARNDLSRKADDVKVEVYKEIQFYSHVLHMVSKVSGQLPDNFHLTSMLGDTFPAGTLSGAPKIRAMELISEYEPTARSFYGGCIGQIGFNRSLNQAIMIRSFLSKGGKLIFQAGAGIVADSDEKRELEEVNNKLAALRKAIELA